jgi:hypothetical protein
MVTTPGVLLHVLAHGSILVLLLLLLLLLCCCFCSRRCATSAY